MTPRPEVIPEAKDLTLTKTSPRTRWIWLRPRGRFQVWTMKIRLLLIPTPTTRFSNKPRPSRIEGRRPLFFAMINARAQIRNDEWSWWRMTSLFPDLPACFLDECFRALLGPALAWLIVTYWNVNKREKGWVEVNGGKTPLILEDTKLWRHHSQIVHYLFCIPTTYLYCHLSKDFPKYWPKMLFLIGGLNL